MPGQWRHNYQREERGTGMQIQYNYVTLNAHLELRSLILCTHLCAFMKICLFLWLYQLIIGGSSPDAKATIR